MPPADPRPEAAEAAGTQPKRGLLGRLDEALAFGNFTRWVLLATLVGVTGGIAAAIFKWLVAAAKELLFQSPTGLSTEGALGVGGKAWLVVLVPTLGGLVAGWLIFKFAPEAEGHGTDSVIRAFHRLKGVVRARVIALKTLTSAITIGTGGSAGQEGPVAQVGAGVGSTLANALDLSARDRRLFLLSGASAGVGAMFCSPLGGALFMPEVLYRKAEFEGEAIIPCIISSIMAYTTFTTLSGAHRAVSIDEAQLGELTFHDPRQLAVYLLLGIICALVGFVYTKVFHGTDRLFNSMRAVPRWVRPGIGGLALGLLALALIPTTGSHGVLFGGYGLMESAIEGNLTLPILLTLVFAKILATSVTISSGGSGGVFAPALAIGALLGAAVGQGAQAIIPGLVPHPAAFALVGMGGFFAGVAKVPIAAVVMVTEMPGGYALLAPLMLVAVVHMLLSTRWTMYEAQVSSLIDSPAHSGEFVLDVLEGLRVEDVLKDARAPRVIHEDVTLRAAMKIVSTSHETHFPVVDDDDRLVGIFSLTDLRRIFLEDIVEEFVIVRDFMHEQVVTVKMSDGLGKVQRILTAENISAVPVVDEEGRRVLALLERNTLGQSYAERLEQLKTPG